jgi:ZIP family zinc transporter
MPVAAAALAGAHLPGRLVVAGTVLMAVATVLGAWLARRGPGRHEVWLGAAGGALLVIAGLHLLPDAWSAARAARIWAPTVPAAALASFVLAGLVARKGCACGSGGHHADGAGAAAALAVHRFLEGSALALAASVIVAAALAVHALADGLAVGALLDCQPRRRVAGWLAVMCLSPAAGAVAASAYPVPAAAGPVLLALAAGVLGQAARMSLSAATGQAPAGRGRAPLWRLAPGTAAAVLAAAAITAVAVRVVG